MEITCNVLLDHQCDLPVKGHGKLLIKPGYMGFNANSSNGNWLGIKYMR